MRWGWMFQLYCYFHDGCVLYAWGSAKRQGKPSDHYICRSSTAKSQSGPVLRPAGHHRETRSGTEYQVAMFG